MILARYDNGNCTVTLYDDGTKVREWPDGSVPEPSFPESVDLKITNTCDLGCAWCHESAIKKEDHASLDRMLSAVRGLPRGVEIAIGGGNPLDYPLLENLLSEFKRLGLVSNMTVHGNHAFSQSEYLKTLQDARLLHGVGISGPSQYNMMRINDMLPANSVLHAIVGVDDPFEILKTEGSPVLVLGYKTYGRGGIYQKGEISNLGKWKYFIGAILRDSKSVSFDNLALTQLRIRDLVDDSTWSKHYMGDDGRFTMYFDAVKNQYAVSSTRDRQDAGEMTIPEMFREVIGQHR